MRGSGGVERIAPRYALAFLAALAYVAGAAALYAPAGSAAPWAAILVGAALVAALVALLQARHAPRLAPEGLLRGRRVVPLADLAGARARPWGVELRPASGSRVVLWDVRAPGRVAARLREAARGHAEEKR